MYIKYLTRAHELRSICEMVVGLGVNLLILLAIISCYVLDYFNAVLILHDSMLQCKRDINLCHEPCKKVNEREERWAFTPG